MPQATEAPASLPELPSAFPPGSLLPLAMPLLQLLGRLRTLAAETDPAALRGRTEAALHEFETRGRAAGIPADPLRRGHYALCHSLDAAALNTPWGAAGPWAGQTLVATLHPAIGPGRFADALHQAQTRPELAPVLELMFACLSVGLPDEPARGAAAAALLGNESPAVELSPAWRGADIPVQPRRRVRLPVWVAAAAALAAGVAGFVWLRAGVDAQGDALFAALLAAPPAQMPAIARDPAPPLPAPPPAPVPTAQDRLRTRLAADAETVSVAGTPGAPILRLPAKILFASNTATLLPAAAPLLQRVAAALQPEGGSLRVLGYTDDRPVRTVAFPSAFKLSAARADAIRAVLVAALPGVTLAAEGRGAAEPLAPNTAEPGREQNRRVDLLLEPARAAAVTP